MQSLNLNQDITQLARRIRHDILVSTTASGSGHPSSSLSAVELMATLMFGGFFRYDLDHSDYVNNDRLIFSKGHAAPLLYSLFAAAGRVSRDELMTLRKFGSALEGHPTPRWRYTEAATGSLGQGLSVGLGMALNAKIGHLPYRTFVLMGDSEMAEGSVWEAMEIAAHYRLDNLMGIIDVNGLGQRGATMYGHDVDVYEKRSAAFGWHAIVVQDGHSISEVNAAYEEAGKIKDKPVMIIARTIKGKGVSFIENKNGWHGKALSQEELTRALAELGSVDTALQGTVVAPEDVSPHVSTASAGELQPPTYAPDKPVSTRRAYGNALARISGSMPAVVALDAEVSNSTYADALATVHPERFFEMFLAEQNMVGVALGLALRGKIPFVSSFAAFLTRAFDQIRMSRYSGGNIKFVGSHAGVSIGEDGASQMALEDIAMFRAIQDSIVFYPSDAMSTERIIELAARHRGMVYIRTTRKDTPVLYGPEEQFVIGGSKTIRASAHDAITLVAAGITLHEALGAYEELNKQGIYVRVIDLYSIKPIDVATLVKSAAETRAILTIEDHVPEGGMGEAVRSALAGIATPVHSLAVTKIPMSGKPDELLRYEGISRDAIVKKVKELIG